MAHKNGRPPLQWLRATAAVALAAFLLPIAIVLLPIAIVASFLPKGRKCSPAKLAAKLRKFADGTESEWDWDDLECVPIRDPRLEAIRQEAMTVSPPLRAEDRTKLGPLSAKASALSP